MDEKAKLRSALAALADLAKEMANVGSFPGEWLPLFEPAYERARELIAESPCISDARVCGQWLFDVVLDDAGPDVHPDGDMVARLVPVDDRGVVESILAETLGGPVTLAVHEQRQPTAPEVTP